MATAKINTPFECNMGKVPSTKGVTGMDNKNRPPFDKPHSMGKDTIPVKFFEGTGDKLGPLTPNPEKFQTPYGNTLTAKGAIDRQSRKQGD